MKGATESVGTTLDLQKLIREDAGLARLLDTLGSRLADGDASHALDHLLRVAIWAIKLTRGQPTIRLAIATALLHDAENIRKDSPDRLSASTRSANLATHVLPGLGFSRDDVALACDAIRSHSRSSGLSPNTAFGRAFQDADRLDSLGVVALTRSLTTGGQLGQEIFCWTDPWAEHRPLARKRYTVDHVLGDLLPLPATLHTAAAREEGQRRVGTMLHFLTAWGTELGSPFPAWRYYLTYASPPPPRAHWASDQPIVRDVARADVR